MRLTRQAHDATCTRPDMHMASHENGIARTWQSHAHARHMTWQTHDVVRTSHGMHLIHGIARTWYSHDMEFTLHDMAFT